jgi:tRNA/tmRNA/rRNA uracil-C5-methylase (TrmA/RlmC/RlmD family)
MAVTLTFEIEKVAHGGVFIARDAGQVYFVSGGLPGELVNVEVTQSTKSFSRAEVVEVLKPSEHRVEHFWKAAKQGAGGAEFGHIELSYQRELKTQVLQENLSRMAKFESDVKVVGVAGDAENGLRYRTRIQLNVDASGLAGPSKIRSNEIVFTKELPLAVAEIEELGLQLKNYSGVEKIKIAASNTGDLQWMVDQKIQGSGQLIERVGGRTFRLSVGGFWQSHRLAAAVLSETVIEFERLLGFDPKKSNLDLYSGAGLFSATSSVAFPEANFIAVESSSKAILDGEKSSTDLPNLKFQKADVLKFLRNQPKNTFDTVILDPPRSGAAGKVIAQLIRISPRNVIYVACDPVAVSRDLLTLTQAGYEIKGIQAFDIFPHTHHFETVVALSR